MNKYIRIFLLSFVGFNMSAISLTKKQKSDIHKNVVAAHKAIDKSDEETLVRLEKGIRDETTRKKAQEWRSKGLRDNAQNRASYLAQYYPVDYSDTMAVPS